MKIKLKNGITPNPSEAINSILTQRGIVDIDTFKNPTFECELDYNNLDNIDKGVAVLLDALDTDKNICFVVDADCDGFTSSAILWNYIKQYKPSANLEFLVQDGKKHGLEHVMDEILEDGHFDLVIVPDGGTNDLAQFEMLSQARIPTLVIDHHQAEYEGYDNLPEDIIIINNQMSKNYANKNLCGAGMAYKFCEKLDSILELKLAHNFIDLAALGEIADVMNKTEPEVNWIIQEGLAHIQNEGFRTILESLEHSLGNKSYAPFYNLTSTDVAFYVAPLINAITRVGTIDDNATMFRAFTDPYCRVPSTKRGAKFGDTETAIDQMIRVGNNCKKQQNTIKEKAISQLTMQIEKNGQENDRVLVVEIDDSYEIPNSMTGLVAQNLVSRYQRPVIMGRVSSEGLLRGSIRGSENFAAIPLLKEFLESTGYFEMIAGHSNAAGYSLPVKNIRPFIEYCNKTFKPDDFEACYPVDYDLYSDDARLEALILKICQHPEYWGNGVDEVVFSIKNIPIENPQYMGANKDSVKFHFNGIDYVRFKDSEFADAIAFQDGGFINIVGKAKLNEFRGQVSLQMQIDDYEFVEENKAHAFEF